MVTNRRLIIYYHNVISAKILLSIFREIYKEKNNMIIQKNEFDFPLNYENKISFREIITSILFIQTLSVTP